MTPVKGKVALSFIIIMLLLVSIIVGFYMSNRTNPNPQASPTPNVSPKPLNPQYLAFYYDNTSRKIFLESATTRYGYWTKNDTPMTWFTNGPVIHTGDPVFVVSGTVRNDYTQNDQNKVDYLNRSIVILYVKLYDQNNNSISAPQAYPKVDSNYYTSNQWGFESGKSNSFELYFLMANRNIDHFQILVEYVSSVIPP